jgi:hypothetical protein
VSGKLYLRRTAGIRKKRRKAERIEGRKQMKAKARMHSWME